MTSEVVIDIDCWDLCSSVTSIWSSWKGHLENVPLVFTLDVPMSNFSSFTFFSWLILLCISVFICNWNNSQKLCLWACFESLHIFNNKMEKERFRKMDLFFPSFFLSHTLIFGFGLQGRDLDLAWQKRSISCYWKWFEGSANIALCSPVGCLSWQKMTNECQRCFAPFVYQSR